MQEYSYTKTFFGDDSVRNSVLNELTADLAIPETKIHYVTGGRRSGKSSSIQHALAGIKKSGQFSQLGLQSAADFWRSSPQVEALNHAFGRLFMFNEDDGPFGCTADESWRENYTVLRDNQHPGHYVVHTNSEVMLPMDKELLEGLIKAAKESGISVSIVLDAPIFEQPLIPGQQLPHRRQYFENHSNALRELVDGHPEYLKIYRTEYSLAQIKEVLWGSNEPKLASMLRLEFNVDVDTPPWNEVIRILEARQRRAAGDLLRNEYDRAFQKIIDKQIDAAPNEGMEL